MTTHGDLTFDPQKFSGRLRLFPLPDLVMFPHVMQPLHVFEPRYRDLVAAAVADDHFVGMALLNPGWESNYEGRPSIGRVACLTRIASCRQLADGRYNLFVLGLQRVEIVHELPPDQPFREAEVRLLDDLYPAEAAADRPALQSKLIATFKQILPTLSDNFEQFAPLLSERDSVGHAHRHRRLCPRHRPRREAAIARRALGRSAGGNAAVGAQHKVPNPEVNFPPEFSLN